MGWSQSGTHQITQLQVSPSIQNRSTKPNGLPLILKSLSMFKKKLIKTALDKDLPGSYCLCPFGKKFNSSCKQRCIAKQK
jgi:hypothetical protein